MSTRGIKADESERMKSLVSSEEANKGERHQRQIFHLDSAACTRYVISSRAFFFALSVIPSSASSSSGVVNNGSNSRTSPSFVGTRMNALGFGNDMLSSDGMDEEEPELE